MDKIIIKGLEIFAHHGVFEEENVLGQKFVIDANLYMNTRTAGISDDIKKSVDYGSVCADIKVILSEQNYNLIEAVAEKIASYILLKYELVSAIDVTVKKPWAPVLMPLETLGVSIKRKKHVVYLGLGSNMGDRESYLDMAIDGLNKDEYTKVTKVSDFIETKPYGPVEQDDFLNGCIEIETLYEPEELLSFVHEIEKDAGRERLVHWGPRTLDIDILLYDDIVYDSEDLHIPHMEMHKREFVLAPLSNIAGYKRHPLYKRTINELLENVKKGK